MAVFTIKNLSFTYSQCKTKALDNISFDVNEGEFLLICGSSGSGKSTLLHHLKSCLKPYGTTVGKVVYNYKDLTEYSEYEQTMKIGFVSQNSDDQIVTDKVWHELAFGLESLGTNQAEMRLRIGEMASYFGIQNWFYKNVNELSGGQKQLLNLASIMAMNPDVLILDEPTSQLDPIAASDFLVALKKINNELGITIIVSEHRLEETFSLADDVIVMDNGKIISKGSLQSIVSEIDNNSDFFNSLPTAARISAMLGNTDDAPLTVKQGRAFLNSLDIKRTDVLCDESINKDRENIILELKDCWYRYSKDGDDILKGLTLSLIKGEIYSIVGGNGTGKSTALSVIAGINKCYRGKLKINGKSIGLKKSQINIALLLQDPRTVFVKDSIMDDFEEMKYNFNDSKALHNEILEVAKLMEITYLLEKHPYDLSGGEQQRAAIAKVLLSHPDILLLDEPTKGMDANFKDKFGRTLKLLTNRGVTVLMVSHDIEFCAKHSDRCGLFFDGNIISENTPRRFFSGNHFYTTSANRIARKYFENKVLAEEVVELCRKQKK